MTALTARLDTQTTSPAFLRGLALGVLTSLLLAAAITIVVFAATWHGAPAQAAPAVDAPPAQIVVDQDHPLQPEHGPAVY